jgi:thiamine-monophosphate kinase
LTSTISSLGEHALIARITARLAMPPWVIVGPGDDAAVIEPERGALEVLTTDALVEGIHFDRGFVPPDAIGHRALAGRHHVTLIGGNITRSPGPLMIDVTAIGSVRRRRILRRAGARAGDEVYVTGSIGGGAAGLRALQASATAQGAGVDRFLRPEPRVRAGSLLGANRAATSCVDLSDGLADGVRQLATASGVGVAIDAAALPLLESDVDQALAGGDDYELLFTVRPSQRGRLRGVRNGLGELPLTKIGVVTKDTALVLRTASGDRPLPAGYEHFRKP